MRYKAEVDELLIRSHDEILAAADRMMRRHLRERLVDGVPSGQLTPRIVAEQLNELDDLWQAIARSLEIRTRALDRPETFNGDWFFEFIERELPECYTAWMELSYRARAHAWAKSQQEARQRRDQLPDGQGSVETVIAQEDS